MIEIGFAKGSQTQLRKFGLRLARFALVVLIPGFAGIPGSSPAGTTNYTVQGVLRGVKPEDHQLVIAHEAIPNFMDAMTMPFRVKDAAILTNLAIGRKITFQLHVTQTESWI